MKIVQITKTQVYANPNPALPHIRVKKDEVLKMDDNIADIIIGHDGGVIVTIADPESVEIEIEVEPPVVTPEVVAPVVAPVAANVTGKVKVLDSNQEVKMLDTSKGDLDQSAGWAGEHVKDLIEKNSRQKLIDTCKSNELDTGGNKEELAKRLVTAGVTQIF